MMRMTPSESSSNGIEESGGAAAASSFADLSRLADELAAISDPTVLRQLVLDKERDLNMAAQLGLAVARKNQEIESKLCTLTATVEAKLASQQQSMTNGPQRGGRVFSADVTTRVRSEISYRHQSQPRRTGSALGHQNTVDLNDEEAIDSDPDISSDTPGRHRKSRSRATISHATTRPSANIAAPGEGNGALQGFSSTPTPAAVMQEETEIWLRSVTRMNFDLRRELESVREDLAATRKELERVSTRADESDRTAGEFKRRFVLLERLVTDAQSDASSAAELAQSLATEHSDARDAQRAQAAETRQIARVAERDVGILREAVDRLREHATILGQQQEEAEERVADVIGEYSRLLNQAQEMIRAMTEEGVGAAASGGGGSGGGIGLGARFVTEASNGAELDPEVMAWMTPARPERNELASAFPGVMERHPLQGGVLASTSSRRSSISGGISTASPSLVAFSPLDLRKPPIGLKQLLVERERERGVYEGMVDEMYGSSDGDRSRPSPLSVSMMSASMLSTSSTGALGSPGLGRGDRVRVIHKCSMPRSNE